MSKTITKSALTQVRMPNGQTIATFEDTDDQGQTFDTIGSAMQWLKADDSNEVYGRNTPSDLSD